MGRPIRSSRWFWLAIILAAGTGLGSYVIHALRQPEAPAPQAATPLKAEPAPKAETPLAAALVQTPQSREQIITVERFGRYALKLASAQGASLQLVDRMAGPGPSDGEVGKRDGRLDVFLGPGEHKVVSHFASGAQPPELTVLPFEEINGDKPPQLVEQALVQGELGDGQQRSYWLVIPYRQSVFIEAAGRHLADLRLWKDGSWLVPAIPDNDKSEAHPGQPLAVKRLVTQLEPGLYRLIAYGGVAQPWTEAGTEKPFVLRWGIPELPETMRRQFSVSPFGFDRWRVSGNTSYYRLELPRGDLGSIEVGSYNQGQIFGTSNAVIDKSKRDPVGEVNRQPNVNFQNLVTIRAHAGQDYLLQHFPARRDYNFDIAGDSQFLVAAIRPGLGEDEADLTAVLTETNDAAQGSPKERKIASQTIRLSSSDPWRRHFNLLNETSLLLEVTQPGNYRAEVTGVQADVKLVPLVLTYSPDLRVMPAKLNGGTWNLDAGFYRLTLTPRPEQRGIVGLSLHGEGAPEAAEDSRPLPSAAIFVPVIGKPKSHYFLTSNQPAGFVVKQLPAEMSDDLPLMLQPGDGKALALSVMLPQDGSLQALAEDGHAVPLSLDGTPAATKPAAKAGKHQVSIADPDAAPLFVSLHFTPDAKAVAAPALPTLSDADAKKIPDLPILAAGQPRFLDMEKRESQTFLVKVDSPALYRVETAGLLETSGTMRTQVQPSLNAATANGVGRNMLLQQYLRQGVYLLSIATQGETHGHLGLTLTTAPVCQGGSLSPEIPAHIALGGGEGVAYDLDIAEAGTYRLRVVTPDIASTSVPQPRRYNEDDEDSSDDSGSPKLSPTVTHAKPLIRLEDAGGWPLTTPEQGGTLETKLQPGHYRLIVQPLAMPSRLLTLVKRLDKAPEVSGHGPHPLNLDGTVSNRWDEPAEGEPRTPDAWGFTLPAEADLTLTLSEGMQGEIKAANGDKPAIPLSSRDPWQGRLAAGTYSMQVTSVRPNNRFDYSITASVKQLIAGMSRDVTAPALIPVAVGGGHRVELTSFGSGQVKASLLDKDGRVAVRGEMRADDWNIDLAAQLPAGQYQLKLDPVGQETADTQLNLTELAEIQEPAMAGSENRQWTDGALHSQPLTFGPNDGPLIVAASHSRDATGLALDRHEADGSWVTVASASGLDARLAFPRDPAAASEYRLQVWPLAGSRAPIALALRHPSLSPASESSLASGLSLQPLADIEPSLGVAAVKLNGPGLIRLNSPAAGLIWSDGGERRALAHGAEVTALGSGPLWLVGPTGGEAVHGQRVAPSTDATLALTLNDRQTVTLPLSDDGKGPRLWLAESRVGQPGLSIAPAKDAADPLKAGIDTGSTAALLPDGGDGSGRLLRLWRSDSADEMPVSLRRVAFPRPARDDQDWGEADRSLEAGTALDLTLPEGAKRLRLALPPRMAAALLDKDGAVRRLYWPALHPESILLESDARHLLLLNAAAQAGKLSLGLMPASGGLSLPVGVMLRQTRPSAGLLAVEIPAPAKPMTLLFSGPVKDAWLLGSDGTAQHGSNGLTVSGQATLLLRHQPGLVAAWITDGAAANWLEAAAKAPPQKIAPATLPLSGAEAVWRFAPDQPVLLHLRSAQPVLAASSDKQQSVWPQGADLQQFLPAGQERLIGLRPLQEAALSGSASFSFSPPQPLGEGLGPKLRLAPGDARLFTFTLAEAGAVGVGIKGEADSARMRLFDESGSLLAEGAVAMSDLKAGRYFLLVENRADASAVEIQPALVGVVKPGKAPPEDVKRRYWDMVTVEEGK